MAPSIAGPGSGALLPLHVHAEVLCRMLHLGGPLPHLPGADGSRLRLPGQRRGLLAAHLYWELRHQCTQPALLQILRHLRLRHLRIGCNSLLHHLLLLRQDSAGSGSLWHCWVVHSLDLHSNAGTHLHGPGCLCVLGLCPLRDGDYHQHGLVRGQGNRCLYGDQGFHLKKFGNVLLLCFWDSLVQCHVDGDRSVRGGSILRSLVLQQVSGHEGPGFSCGNWLLDGLQVPLRDPGLWFLHPGPGAVHSDRFLSPEQAGGRSGRGS